MGAGGAIYVGKVNNGSVPILNVANSTFKNNKTEAS